MFSSVILQNRKRLSVPSKWVQNKNPNSSTKIFISANENTEPNFGLSPCFFIQENDACYNGFFLREFANKDAAEAHSMRRRSIYPPIYKTSEKQNCPFVNEEMTFILSDSESTEGMAERAVAPRNDEKFNVSVSRNRNALSCITNMAPPSLIKTPRFEPMDIENEILFHDGSGVGEGLQNDSIESRRPSNEPDEVPQIVWPVASTSTGPNKHAAVVYRVSPYTYPYTRRQEVSSNEIKSAFEKMLDGSTEVSVLHNNDLSKDDIIVKLENELKNSKKVIKVLEDRAGPSRIPDTDTSSEDSATVHQVTAETQQIDEAFSGYHIFTTDMNADRYYLNEKIKIKREIVLILKNMNVNVIQRAKEYDYSFIARLLGQVFGNEILNKSSISTLNAKKIAYANLDLEKYNFVKDVFQIRVENNRARMDNFNNLVNKRCAEINRVQKKVRK